MLNASVFFKLPKHLLKLIPPCFFQMVQSIPKNLLEHYGNEKHMRVKKFMMCNDHMMKMECMCDDAKKMLEKHFKPLSELVQETGMDEMSLLKMTHMLVEDSMDF